MPLPAAPNSSGKFRAPFTPRHWAFSPRNSSVALFLFSPPMQTPPLQLLRRFRVPYPLRLPLYLRPRQFSPRLLTLLRLRRLFVLRLSRRQALVPSSPRATGFPPS